MKSHADDDDVPWSGLIIIFVLWWYFWFNDRCRLVARRLVNRCRNVTDKRK
jgi:hypothetical protein